MTMHCVILSFNHPDLTSRCVSSSLSYFAPSEVLLVHNGSEAKNVSALEKSFPEIRHLVLPKNSGYSGGANAGFDLGFNTCEQILFLTNDCEILQLRAPEITSPGQLALHILKRKTELVDSVGGFLNAAKGALGHLKTVEDWQQCQHRKYIPGSAFLLDRKVWQAGLRFREELHTYWEDVLFSQEVVEHGFSLGTFSGIQIRHGIGKTCHKNPYYTSYLYQRNRRWVSLMYTRNYFERSQFHFYYSISLCRLIFRSLLKKDFSKLRLLSAAAFEKSRLKI